MPPASDPACLFCKIGKGEIKGDILSRDTEMFVLRDIHPQAPVHQLVIPFEHIPSVANLSTKQAPLLGRMASMANEMARKAGLTERGYRLVLNCGPEGGQTVPHLHLHLLGGRQLQGGMG